MESLTIYNKMNGPQNNNTLEAAMVLASISDFPVSQLVPTKQPKNSEDLRTNRCHLSQLDNDRKQLFFPSLLMEIISDPVNSNLIGWLPQGFAFMIKDFAKLNDEITLRFNFETKAIQNELNRWGFKLITRGPKSNVYYHQYFHRDSPSLCERMRIVSYSVDSKFKETVAMQKCQNKALKKCQKNAKKRTQWRPSSLPIDPDKTFKNVEAPKKLNDHLRTVSPSIDEQANKFLPQKEEIKPVRDEKLEDQKKLLLSFFSQRKQANAESLCLLAKQFKPGSKLAEMNKSIHSFRNHHNLVISKSIDALLCAKSS